MEQYSDPDMWSTSIVGVFVGGVVCEREWLGKTANAATFSREQCNREYEDDKALSDIDITMKLEPSRSCSAA